MKIASKYNLFVIENAVQGIMSNYKRKPLGIIGDIGTFSFYVLWIRAKKYFAGCKSNKGIFWNLI